MNIFIKTGVGLGFGGMIYFNYNKFEPLAIFYYKNYFSHNSSFKISDDFSFTLLNLGF